MSGNQNGLDSTMIATLTLGTSRLCTRVELRRLLPSRHTKLAYMSSPDVTQSKRTENNKEQRRDFRLVGSIPRMPFTSKPPFPPRLATLPDSTAPKKIGPRRIVLIEGEREHAIFTQAHAHRPPDVHFVLRPFFFLPPSFYPHPSRPRSLTTVAVPPVPRSSSAFVRRMPIMKPPGHSKYPARAYGSWGTYTDCHSIGNSRLRRA